MSRFGFVFNLDTCSDMRGCMIACKDKTHAFLGAHYMDVKTNVSLDFPRPNTYFVPVLCQHCENPSCVSVCPKGVLSKRADGIVAVGETELCQDCADKPCIKACPYDAIDLDPTNGKIGKCDMCADLIDQGEVPPCTKKCLTQSIMFGDLEDPESIVSQVIAGFEDAGYIHQLKPETGNKPAIYYLLSKKQWEDTDKLYSPAWRNE